MSKSTTKLNTEGYYDDTLTLEDATMHLRELLWEFPFNDRKVEHGSIVTSRSQAVQLAAMFSQIGAGLIPQNESRLGFIYNANSQRSGKSLLAKLAIIPTAGRMATQSWNPKDEEIRKVLDAEVLRGSRYIVFDNVRGHVSSPVLEAFMTAPVWTGRILTKSRMFEASNMATIFVTGNDMTVSPDMAQRCLVCDLFVQEANIQERVVSKPISDAWLMQWKHRHKILSALSTVIRYWSDAGQPLATQNLRAGFQRWCEVFGGLVAFAGFGNCLTMPSEVESHVNTEMEDMKGLVAALAEPLLRVEDRRKRAEYTFQAVVNISHDSGFFDWILDGKEDTSRDFVLTNKTQTKFGRLLSRYAPNSVARIFRITPLDTVRLSCTGKHRHKRFVIERA